MCDMDEKYLHKLLQDAGLMMDECDRSVKTACVGGRVLHWSLVADLPPIVELPMTAVVIESSYSLDTVLENISHYIFKDLSEHIKPETELIVKDKTTDSICKIVHVSDDEKYVVVNLTTGDVTPDLPSDRMYDDFVCLGKDLSMTDVFRWLEDKSSFHNMRSVGLDGLVVDKLGRASGAFKIDFSKPLLKHQSVVFLHFLFTVVCVVESFRRKK